MAPVVPVFQHWCSGSLLIPNEPGQPAIDLMKSFCLDKKTPPSVAPIKRPSIWLPPSIYPPYWKHREILYGKVQSAATTPDGLCRIIVQRSNEGTRTRHGEVKVLLCCEYIRPEYTKGKTKQRQQEYKGGRAAKNGVRSYL